EPAQRLRARAPGRPRAAARRHGGRGGAAPARHGAARAARHGTGRPLRGDLRRARVHRRALPALRAEPGLRGVRAALDGGRPAQAARRRARARERVHEHGARRRGGGRVGRGARRDVPAPPRPHRPRDAGRADHGRGDPSRLLRPARGAPARGGAAV
ncbi:MAG: hypothetical protein AVDCRST_MAG13-4000, partial [uncultured Solirubrobacteraceae bacterium]